ncbi:MYG1 family protein [Marinomonas sp.]|nr:MYG1 family protein [Marinomonas sp.]MDB4837908.1 MYG1 family protein [Marinomonas sp.]
MQEATGLEDATFCHNGLFIAGCESFENVMKMAEMALND